MIYAENRTLRYRQINALSWRVASELSRRDPGLYIGLTGDGGSAAHADALMMTSPSGSKYQARRRGLGFTAGANGEFQLEWDEALHRSSARAIAMALEESLGIHRPEKSPTTSPRALGYRVMASMLESTLGDRKSWSTEEIEGGPLDTDSLSTPARMLPWEAVRWALLCDDETVAQLDNFGWLAIDGRRINLHARYRELNGRLYPLMLEIFGAHLP